MHRLRLPPGAPTTLELDGQPVPAYEGEPIACALLAANHSVFSRSPKYHRPRGPFCFTGSCSHCLMRVNGIPNVFTCQTPVGPSTRVESQNAFPSVETDALGALDWLFPRGMDHHRLFAGVPIAEQLMTQVARGLAGLGVLPDAPAQVTLPTETFQTPLLIVGGGASGLAAAQVLSAAAHPFLLIERDASIGGRSTALDFSLPRTVLHSSTTAIGFYEDARGRFVAGVAQRATGTALLKVYADRFLFCTGGHPALEAFSGNDLPGVLAAHALVRLVEHHHLAPDGPVCVVGRGDPLASATTWLRGQGIEVSGTLELAPGDSDPSLIAHGHSHLTAVSWLPRGSSLRIRLECRTLVVAGLDAPRLELAQQAGARVGFSAEMERFTVSVDAQGRTSVPTVWISGQAARPCSVAASIEAGRQIGRALLDSKT